jgi:predicted secreted hydrolase
MKLYAEVALTLAIAMALAAALTLDVFPMRGREAIAAANSPASTGPVPTAAAVFDSSGFRLAIPPREFAFPRDHASHPEFRVEWWYYTGHLGAPERSLGYELTFFRVGLSRAPRVNGSKWAARDAMFAHLALTDETRSRFRSDEAASRAALGLAGADTTRYHTWLHDWSAELERDNRTHRLRARTADFGIALELSPEKPPVIHGENGVSQKSAGAGNASHYYSMTRLTTRGRVFDGNDSLEVTGLSWMDHEFGSAGLSSGQIGWDWFSVQLDDGRELMLYRLRLKNGRTEPLSSGTLVQKDGTTRHLALRDFRISSSRRWLSPETGAEYPSGWRIEVPSERLSLDITPTVKGQELVSRTMGGVVYWEGSCKVRGRSHGAAIAGLSYVELTGYTGTPPY